MSTVRVSVRDVELDYDLAGVGAAFVWGHGLSGNRGAEDEFGVLDWGRFDAPCQLLRYDARGHGASGVSEEPSTYAWDELARDQLALLDALGIDDYIAGGASMGCGTALHAALLAPDRVKGLVLVLPPTAWETRRQRVAMTMVPAGGHRPSKTGATLSDCIEASSTSEFSIPSTAGRFR